MSAEQTKKLDEKAKLEQQYDTMVACMGYVRATPADVERRKQNYARLIDRIPLKGDMRVYWDPEVQLILAACNDRVNFYTPKKFETKMHATRRNFSDAISHFQERLTWEMLDKVDDHKLGMLGSSFVMHYDYIELIDIAYYVHDYLERITNVMTNAYCVDMKTLEKCAEETRCNAIDYLNINERRLTRIRILKTQFATYTDRIDLQALFYEYTQLGNKIREAKKQLKKDLISLINDN